MTELTNLLKHFNIDMESLSKMSHAELKMNSYNKSKGNLTGYDCKECNNRGDFLYIKNGLDYFRECKCMEIRKNRKQLEKSGMYDMFKRYTFENFRVTENWQEDIITKAMEFSENPEGWFFMGGQPGTGKTHLCTAIANVLVQKGMMIKYMLWRDDSVKLKASITDDKAYLKLINPIKNAEVLFIDDFFKAPTGYPSFADVSIAYEILNYRYNNRKLITLISSEMLLEKICAIDEATGSRIIEMANKNAINIGKDKGKNYRLKNI